MPSGADTHTITQSDGNQKQFNLKKPGTVDADRHAPGLINIL